MNGAPSFQIQTAPVLPGYAYWLNGVTVLRSTIAFAVGGNAFGSAGSSLPGNTATAANNGIILGTFNGGFTWTQQARARQIHAAPARVFLSALESLPVLCRCCRRLSR